MRWHSEKLNASRTVDEKGRLIFSIGWSASGFFAMQFITFMMKTQHKSTVGYEMVDLELGTHIHSAPDCSTLNQFSSILCSFATQTNGGIVTLAQCIWMLCKNVCQWDNSSQCTKLLKFIRIFSVLLLLSFRSFMFPPGNDNLNLESKFHCELANLLQLTFFCTMDIIRIWNGWWLLGLRWNAIRLLLCELIRC